MRDRVRRTLALEPRGAILDDGLPLRRLSNYLEVEWCARDVHPWNDDLPDERRTELFVAQALYDTRTAIERLFNDLAEVDTMHIRVLQPVPPHQPLLAGTVARDSVADARQFEAPGMSLKALGVQYRVVGGSLEPLVNFDAPPTSSSRSGSCGGGTTPRVRLEEPARQNGRPTGVPG